MTRGRTPLRLAALAIPFTPFAQGFQLLLHHPIAAGDLNVHQVSFARQAGLFGVLIALGTAGHALVAAVRAPRLQGGAA